MTVAVISLSRKSGREINMCEGPMLKNILLFTVPIFLTQVLQLLFNAADLMIVGNFCGSDSIAAVGATGSFCALFVNVFAGLGAGVGVAIARATGAQDRKKCEKVVHTAVPLALICGGLVNLLLVLLAETAMTLMGTPEEVLSLAALYIRVYSFGMLPSLLYNFCAAILRSRGDSRRPLYYLTFSGVLNVVLNTIFVTLFDMDVAGVALATTISHLASAALVVIQLMRRGDECRLIPGKMRIHLPELKEIVRIGLPAGIQSSMFSVSNVIIQSAINSFGTIVMAGSSAASSIANFVYAGVNAFHQTGMTFVGQNYGARKLDRVRRAARICVLCAMAIEIILGGIAILFGRPLLSIYIKDSAEALRYGLIRLTLLGSMYFIAGAMDVSGGVLRGLGCSLPPMITSIFAHCIFRSAWALLVFPAFRASPYAWEILLISYPISWLVAAIVNWLIYRRHIEKTRQKFALEDAAAAIQAD